MENHGPLLHALMAGIEAPVCIVAADGRVTCANAAWHETAGSDPALETVPDAGLMAEVAQALAMGQPRETRLTLPGGTEAVRLRIVPADAACVLILQAPANAPDKGIDPLTGLPARHLFLDRLGQATHHAGRAKQSVAVILVGIDGLERIVDVRGRQAGDRILAGIAGRLRQCVRVSDTVARIDTDRFAFAMQIAAIDDSVLVNEKILRAFEKPFATDEQSDVAVGCALGVSIFPADGEDATTLVRNAGVALHHAAQGGPGRCQFFSAEMNERARRRLTVESGIRRGLANREFLVYYQPKIAVNQGRVAGMEALVRWSDPERGMVSPGEFIPVAEESGLIEQIGLWVLEETCTQNRRWQDEGLPAVKASVNVSARQFRNRNFVATVEEVLARTGLEARWLELEITESMLMGDIEAVIARMEELRKIGVALSIDDFGTGYSSLSYLSRFPITTLKIDRAFIADVQHNPHTAEIARAIIGLSRGLDLEVVAEGAEVAEQVEFLRAHGCELVQGFYYSRPLPAVEFAHMLRHGPAHSR